MGRRWLHTARTYDLPVQDRLNRSCRAWRDLQETTIVYWGYTWIMEKMESTTVYLGYIGIIGKEMESTILGVS